MVDSGTAANPEVAWRHGSLSWAGRVPERARSAPGRLGLSCFSTGDLFPSEIEARTPSARSSNGTSPPGISREASAVSEA